MMVQPLQFEADLKHPCILKTFTTLFHSIFYLLFKRKLKTTLASNRKVRSILKTTNPDFSNDVYYVLSKES